MAVRPFDEERSQILSFDAAFALISAALTKKYNVAIVPGNYMLIQRCYTSEATVSFLHCNCNKCQGSTLDSTLHLPSLKNVTVIILAREFVDFKLF
jgi:hypothetical protein